MSPKPLSPIRSAWYKWKALRWVPGRKRFLIGFDLQGNTFWEFRDTLSSHKHRMRRIVEYPPGTHYSEINLPPQWHQWLRHTRSDAPSIGEQAQDVVRQENLKILAARADARWAAKPSYLDRPRQAGQSMLDSGQPGQQTKVRSSVDENISTRARQGLRDRTLAGSQAQALGGSEETKISQPQTETRHHEYFGQEGPTPKNTVGRHEKEDPWTQARGGPSEQWQPKAWDGGIAPTQR